LLHVPKDERQKEKKKRRRGRRRIRKEKKKDKETIFRVALLLSQKLLIRKRTQRNKNTEDCLDNFTWVLSQPEGWKSSEQPTTTKDSPGRGGRGDVQLGGARASCRITSGITLSGNKQLRIKEKFRRKGGKAIRRGGVRGEAAPGPLCKSLSRVFSGRSIQGKHRRKNAEKTGGKKGQEKEGECLRGKSRLK